MAAPWRSLVPSLIVVATATAVAFTGVPAGATPSAGGGGEPSAAARQAQQAQKTKQSTGRLIGTVDNGARRPVVGGRVRLATLQGRPLCGAPRTPRCGRTAGNGAFALKVRHLPAHFVVSVRGGQVNGRRVVGQTRAVVTKWRGQPVFVTPATTVAAALLPNRRAKKLSAATLLAERRTRKILGIERWQNLSSDAALHRGAFPATAFARLERRLGPGDALALGGAVRHVVEHWSRRPVFRELDDRVSSAGGTDDKFPDLYLKAFKTKAVKADAEKGIEDVADSMDVDLLDATGAGAVWDQLLALGIGNVFGMMGLGDDSDTDEIAQQLAQLQEQVIELQNDMNDKFQALSLKIDKTTLVSRTAGVSSALAAIDAAMQAQYVATQSCDRTAAGYSANTCNTANGQAWGLTVAAVVVGTSSSNPKVTCDADSVPSTKTGATLLSKWLGGDGTTIDGGGALGDIWSAVYVAQQGAPKYSKLISRDLTDDYFQTASYLTSYVPQYNQLVSSFWTGLATKQPDIDCDTYAAWLLDLRGTTAPADPQPGTGTGVLQRLSGALPAVPPRQVVIAPAAGQWLSPNSDYQSDPVAPAAKAYWSIPYWNGGWESPYPDPEPVTTGLKDAYDQRTGSGERASPTDGCVGLRYWIYALHSSAQQQQTLRPTALNRVAQCGDGGGRIVGSTSEAMAEQLTADGNPTQMPMQGLWRLPVAPLEGNESAGSLADSSDFDSFYNSFGDVVSGDKGKNPDPTSVVPDGFFGDPNHAATIRFSNDKANCDSFSQSTPQGDEYYVTDCASGSIAPVMSVWTDGGDVTSFANLCGIGTDTDLGSLDRVGQRPTYDAPSSWNSGQNLLNTRCAIPIYSGAVNSVSSDLENGDPQRLIAVAYLNDEQEQRFVYRSPTSNF